MNVSRIKIQGFKCFLDSTIELKNLTVLCGSNGSGKSSVIQAILLARLSIEKNSPLIGDSYNLDRWNNVPVPLNGFYELNLGEREEIENGHQFKIDIDGLSFLMKERDSIGLNLREDNILVDCSGAVPDNAFITRREFYYLNAERIGPRYISEFVPMDFPNCGFKGEKTGQVYYDFDKSFYKVESSRCFPGKKGAFRMQADAWIDYICPGITPTVEYIGRLSGQIRLRNNMINKLSAATNIGFGVSYLLPIVVTGLIAEHNTLFIVESSWEVTLVTTTLSRLTTGFSCPDCCLGVSSSCAITNVAKIVVKRYLQKGWCEPASGKNNGLSDRCESVGVLLSEGGNTSAYLETER